MAITKNTLALVLGRQSYHEYDSLITAYTLSQGKVSLVARGTKKLQSKLAGQLEPISLVELMIVTGKHQDYVGGAVVSNHFLGIRSDLNKLYYAGQALKIFSRLVQGGQADRTLFFLLKDWLEFLDLFESADQGLDKLRGELFLDFFIIRLLIVLGYQPEMYRCSFCQKEIAVSKNYFSFEAGSVIDSKCWSENSLQADNSVIPISNDCIKLLRFIINNNLEQIKQLKLKTKLLSELSTLVNNLLNFIY